MRRFHWRRPWAAAVWASEVGGGLLLAAGLFSPLGTLAVAAVGVLGFFEPDGLALRQRFCARLGLGEPGIWAHVPPTTNPNEPSTVVRMGSIPHGTVILAQLGVLGALDAAVRPDVQA